MKALNTLKAGLTRAERRIARQEEERDRINEIRRRLAFENDPANRAMRLVDGAERRSGMNLERLLLRVLYAHERDGDRTFGDSPQQWLSDYFTVPSIERDALRPMLIEWVTRQMEKVPLGDPEQTRRGRPDEPM